MRLSLVSGYFVEGRGYQENVWAEQLGSLGHDVCVFTSEYLPRGITHDRRRGLLPYRIFRVEAKRYPSGIILSNSLSGALREYAPDWVLWFGVGQFFGLYLLLSPLIRKAPVVSFFGENLGMHEFDWRKRGISLTQRIRAIGFRQLRGPLYRAVFDRSRWVIATKRQTADILLDLCKRRSQRAALARKLVNIPLGYSPEVFFPDRLCRERVRRELGLVNGDVLVITSSRFSPGKRLNELVLSLMHAVCADRRLRVCLVGFSQDNPVARQIQRLIDSGSCADRFIKHPFTTRERLAELFNAGDIGLYDNPSISVQEAMGTGLFMCLSGNGSMQHLLGHADTGLFYHPHDRASKAEALKKAADIVSSNNDTAYWGWRNRIHKRNRWLGYDRMAAELIRLMLNSEPRRKQIRRPGDRRGEPECE